jgi:hypothetical protein
VVKAIIRRRKQMLCIGQLDSITITIMIIKIILLEFMSNVAGS